MHGFAPFVIVAGLAAVYWGCVPGSASVTIWVSFRMAAYPAAQITVTKIAVLVIREFVFVGFGLEVYAVSDACEHDPDGFCFL